MRLPLPRNQLFNAFLRLLPMVAKLCLTLFMGRFYALEEMGTYGLVLGCVVILSIFLGQRLDYVVNRDIVGAQPKLVFQRLRDEALLYLANHCVLALVLGGMLAFRASPVSPAVAIGIFLLAVFENFSCALYGHLNALQRQVFANVLFFVRSGLWVLPVLLFGALSPVYRTVPFLMLCWVPAEALCLLLALWGLRGLPWREGLRAPVDRVWVRGALRKSVFIWLGNVGYAAGMYLDRFVAAGALDLQAAGVVTFYTSFTMALFALVQSGVLAFAGPRLILLFKAQDEDGFWREARGARRQVLISAALLACLAGIAIPLFGLLVGRPIYFHYAGLLALLLLATWLRGWADVHYNILFARTMDRPIWLGDLLFLLPALGGNLLFVPLFGLWGVGFSSVFAALFQLLWRHFFVSSAHSKKIS